MMWNINEHQAFIGYFTRVSYHRVFQIHTVFVSPRVDDPWLLGLKPPSRDRSTAGCYCQWNSSMESLGLQEAEGRDWGSRSHQWIGLRENLQENP